MSMVYVMQADNGELKIGWSGAPYARLSKVKGEYGPRRGFVDLRLVGMVRTAAFIETEILVHARVAAAATGGEWYRMDAEDALATALDVALQLDSDAAIVRPQQSRKALPRAARVGCRIGTALGMDSMPAGADSRL